MRKPTVRYSKGEIGQVGIVEDFLPSPDRLVLREENRASRLTDEQVEEVPRQRDNLNRQKLTLDELKVRLRHRLGE